MKLLSLSERQNGRDVDPAGRFQSSLWSYYHCQESFKIVIEVAKEISIFFMKLLSLSALGL